MNRLFRTAFATLLLIATPLTNAAVINAEPTIIGSALELQLQLQR